MNYKTVASFLLGVAVGGFTAVYLMKSYYEELAEQEIQDYKDWCEERDRVEPPTPASSFEEATKAFQGFSQFVDSRNYAAQAAKYMAPTEAQKPSLSELAALVAEDEMGENAADDEDLEDELAEETALNPPRMGQPDIYEIDEDTFCRDQTFQKDQLTFYAGDDTLSNERDEILDIEHTVGFDCLDHFDPETGIVFVRNEILEIDFEIERVPYAYVSYVLGLDPDEAPPPKHRSPKESLEEDEDE